MTPSLPARFLFGAATAAAQIEGAALTDGRTASIWDAFADVPGKIADHTTPTVAVDHYHRWLEDVALLADLGVDAYRFSISWSRLIPHGRGPVNRAGADFYSRLVDGLLARNIQPWVTLYHWDMPVEIMAEGGWLHRGSIDVFTDYVAVVADLLGDRVTAWMTLNEPVVHTGYGYALGIEAPGLTLYGRAFQAAHHQLMAHGRAARILADVPGKVGIVNNHTPVRPASDRDEDLLAAGMYDVYHNGQYAAPVLTGSYPEVLGLLPGVDLNLIRDGDLAEIAAPIDFYGVNYYQPTTVAADPDNQNLPFAFLDPSGVPVTDFGWAVDPAALTEFLIALRDTYPSLPPVYITENGCAYDDVRGADGGIEPDDGRIDYLRAHLDATADAIAAGVDVRGYFYWTLMDNWEWAEGMRRRFGLVRIEPHTLERVPRASFRDFRDFIAAHRAGR